MVLSAGFQEGLSVGLQCAPGKPHKAFILHNRLGLGCCGAHLGNPSHAELGSCLG